MIKNNEKNTAIRLINKYADEYRLLETQNQELTQINKDLRSNLKINKDIIDSFFKKVPFDPSAKKLIDKLQQENSSLTTTNDKLQKQINLLNIKVANLTALIKTNSIIYSKETDKIKTELFIIKNILKMKENQAALRHSKKSKGSSVYSKHSNGHENNLELFVVSPNSVINRLNDEVETYKEINTKLNKHAGTLKSCIKNYENLIHKYETDIVKYKEEISNLRQANSTNKIISKLGYQNFFHNPNTNNAQNNPSGEARKNYKKSRSFLNLNVRCNTESSSNITGKLNKSYISNLEQANRSKQKMNSINLTEEWIDTLKFCGLTQEEYLSFCSIKKLSKLTDAIEYLYKVIVDKNIQIALLTDENDCLNAENIKLNKANLELEERTETMISKSKENGISQIDDKGGSVFVNTDTSDIVQKRKDNYILGDYSVTSSEFREGMVVDRFDIESQMSKVVKKC